MNLVLDAGALLGIDRDDRRIAGLLELGRRVAADLVTRAPVVGQAWRDGPRQPRSARALAMVDVRPVTTDDASAPWSSSVAPAPPTSSTPWWLCSPAPAISSSRPTLTTWPSSEARRVDVRIVTV